MSGTPITVFVNGKALSVPSGSTVRDAVMAAEAGLVDDPACRVTDARGIAVALDTPLESGHILRAARSARRANVSDA